MKVINEFLEKFEVISGMFGNMDSASPNPVAQKKIDEPKMLVVTKMSVFKCQNNMSLENKTQFIS